MAHRSSQVREILMGTIKGEIGAAQTVLSTELNALANNAGAISTTAFDNATVLALWLFGDFELNVTFAAAPSANTFIDMYLLPSLNGTTFNDGTSGASALGVASNFIGSFPIRNVVTAQQLTLPVSAPVRLPLSLFKIQLINRSGVAFPAAGSTIRMYPSRYQN